MKSCIIVCSKRRFLVLLLLCLIRWFVGWMNAISYEQFQSAKDGQWNKCLPVRFLSVLLPLVSTCRRSLTTTTIQTVQLIFFSPLFVVSSSSSPFRLDHYRERRRILFFYFAQRHWRYTINNCSASILSTISWLSFFFIISSFFVKIKNQ